MTSRTATSSGRWGEVLDLFRTRMLSVRIQRRMSQTELGTLAGLTRFAISDIEAGERSPRLPEAVIICEALGVDLVDMLGDAEPVLVTEQRIEFRPHATTSR